MTIRGIGRAFLAGLAIAVVGVSCSATNEADAGVDAVPDVSGELHAADVVRDAAGDLHADVADDTCHPRCEDKECGYDGCTGSCGSCRCGELCDAEGLCVAGCVPVCDGRECGDDGCGCSCGSCLDDEVCDPSGACVVETFLTWDQLVPDCGKQLQVYDAEDPLVVVGEEDNCQAVSFCLFWGGEKAKIIGVTPSLPP